MIRHLLAAVTLCALASSPALAGDASFSAFYSPDRLGADGPVFLSFSGTWDRGEDRLLLVDAGLDFRSRFLVGTYWLGGYGIRLQERLSLALSAGGIGTNEGGSLVIGPSVRVDLVGPLSFRYIGLQRIAAESGCNVKSFTHLFGVQLTTLRF